jgi:hypothetical protein
MKCIPFNKIDIGVREYMNRGAVKLNPSYFVPSTRLNI